MFLVELIVSSFLDQISKQARRNAVVSVFLLLLKNVSWSDVRMLHKSDKYKRFNRPFFCFFIPHRSNSIEGRRRKNGLVSRQIVNTLLPRKLKLLCFVELLKFV